MFITEKDCQKVGNSLCAYLNNIPMTAIESGRRYFYNLKQGLCYLTPNGQTCLVRANERTLEETYKDLQSSDCVNELLLSMVS